MVKIVEMLQDFYPYGCKGDVVGLTSEEVAELDKKRESGAPIYKDVNDAEADQTTTKKDEKPSGNVDTASQADQRTADKKDAK